MPTIPFIGRLRIREYIALVLSFILIFLEGFIRIITLALPTPVILFCYRASRRVFNSLQSQQGKKSRGKKKAITNSIAEASDFVELCELWGYYAEEHIVQTGDGYLLGLHRLCCRQGEQEWRVNSGKASLRKKVVYLHHGLLMNSEVWVCLTEKERCLPFQLVEKGYDVWLGNNRGNKYSKKSIHYAPTEDKFWNFSMDQFAFHDIPDSINYILETTEQPSLSYIGFSQGTAQAFATLSIHPTLNEKVDVFIALAPAMSPAGLTSSIVDSFVKASPDVLFLAFGRKAILSSTTMWQAILYPPIFVRLLDLSLKFLFGWTAKNIPMHQKLAAYPHLYSFTSTKSVVHWFQIIRNGIFQMYDDEVQAPLSIKNGSYYYKVAKFPTRNIKTPVVLVYGGSDSLVDIKIMLKELPKHTVAKEVPHYEHLDFLWAGTVDTFVFPHVFDALERYEDPEARPRGPLLSPFKNEGPLGFSDEDTFGSAGSPLPRAIKKISENVPPAIMEMQSRASLNAPALLRESGEDAEGPAEAAWMGSSSISKRSAADHTTHSSPLSDRPSQSQSPIVASRSHGEHGRQASRIPSLARSSAQGTETSAKSNQTSQSRPEGWWSSDEVADTSRPSTPAAADKESPLSPVESLRARSVQRKGSRISIESGGSGSESKVGFGRSGITVGASKPVGGVDMAGASGKGSGLGSSAGSKKRGPTNDDRRDHEDAAVDDRSDNGKRRKGRRKVDIVHPSH